MQNLPVAIFQLQNPSKGEPETPQARKNNEDMGAAILQRQNNPVRGEGVETERWQTEESPKTNNRAVLSGSPLQALQTTDTEVMQSDLRHFFPLGLKNQTTTKPTIVRTPSRLPGSRHLVKL